jgi:hypothetical protein
MESNSPLLEATMTTKLRRTTENTLEGPGGKLASINAALLAAMLAGPAAAATVTLQASSGGTWTGSANTCTYSGLVTDSAGNVVVTCQGGGGGSSPTPPTIGNAPNKSLTQNAAMTALSLAAYVTPTDGDPILAYSYTGTLPAGLSFNTTTGVISGTPTAVGTSTITWTAADKDGPGTGDAIQFTVSAASASGCGATPGNYTVVQPGGSAFGGTWSPDSSSASYTAQLPVGSGVALQFNANKNAYPFGFKITDSTGGSKSYVISRCPGSTTPVDNQDGTTSVNADARLDSCKIVNGYARWKDTSGATAVYYAGTPLSYQTTCFLPTTTDLGSSTAATYYLNILNTGTSAVGIQYSNNPQIN